MNTNTISYMEYFLGANTGKGFKSFFESSYDLRDGWRVWIIKGGPGTGKSTAMKRVAQKAEEMGVYHERCRCSSDPDSFDAVIIPELKRAVYDGTAPHVLEPRLAGACENIVNLGDAWDKEKLFRLREDIAAVSDQCANFHAAAQRWLRSADAFRENSFLLAKNCTDENKIVKSAEKLAERLLSGRIKFISDNNTPTVRELTAVTPKGVIMPGKEIIEQLENRYIIDDKTGAASSLLLDRLADIISGCGVETVKGVCSQSGRTEHIIAPSLSAVVSVNNTMHSVSGNMRIIHSERFLTRDFEREHGGRMKLNRNGIKEMTERACSEMAQAKVLHDKLESLYTCAMDYDKVIEIADKLLKEIL